MRVIGWPAFRKPPWNPYTELLYRHVAARGVEVEEFDPWRLLHARGALLHIHWPDALWNDRFALRAIAKAAALLALLQVARWRGTRVVWTVHNLASHERRYLRLERIFWRLLVTQLDGLISPSAAGLDSVRRTYRELRRIPGRVVPLGHFRGFYAGSTGPRAARRTLGIAQNAQMVLHLGRIRRYKNVPALVVAFRTLDSADASLVIAGVVESADLESEIRAAAASAANVQLHLAYIPDGEIQLFLRAAHLVILPFREILNSASAILALSFDRPVLVPRKGAMAELQALVGPQWVRTYEGNLTPSVLREALDWARSTDRPDHAPLDALSWDRIADETIALYRAVVQ